MKEAGRNDLCPCGSGRKYKKCCMPGTKAVQPAPMPVELFMQIALAHQQAGRLAEASAIYQEILRESPHDADALHLLGMIAHQSGDNALAADHIGRAIAVAPDLAELHNNLGLVLVSLGRNDEAVASYQRAIALRPDYAHAHNNLGAALQGQGNLVDAIACFQTALAIKPDYATAHNNLGGALLRMGKREESVMSYQKAVAINPDYADAHYGLGGEFVNQGKFSDAIACFRRVIEIEPENRVARHMISALTGTHSERAPGEYVVNVFDSYADHFDQHLTQVLKCDIPERLLALIKASSRTPAEKWDVLDLGCGTGLAGSAIAPFARQLVGVDLSGKMLEKAREKNIYSRLVQADLLGMLKAEAASAYDVVTAADVFIYLGRIDAVVADVKRVLRSGGLFAFSIESLDASPPPQPDQLAAPESTAGKSEEYKLMPTGRFAHSADYLNRLATEHNFRIIEMQATQLRVEQGKAVQGFIALWTS